MLQQKLLCTGILLGLLMTGSAVLCGERDVAQRELQPFNYQQKFIIKNTVQDVNLRQLKNKNNKEKKHLKDQCKKQEQRPRGKNFCNKYYNARD
jgi:hypothetical protein